MSVRSREESVSKEKYLEIKFVLLLFIELVTWSLSWNWLGSTRAPAISLQNNLIWMISFVTLLDVTLSPSGLLCSVWLTSSLSLCVRVHSLWFCLLDQPSKHCLPFGSRNMTLTVVCRCSLSLFFWGQFFFLFYFLKFCFVWGRKTFFCLR